MANSTVHLQKTLKNIGFSDKEAKVYLALLELGPSAVREISLKSGLKKPTTYVILDELRQKDAVLFLPSAKKKLYSAKDPEELFELAKTKLRNAVADLPILKQLGKQNNPKAMVTYFEGLEGYAQSMSFKEQEVFANKELRCYFASAFNIVNPLMLPEVDKYMNKLRKNHVRLRAFAPDHESLADYRERDKDFFSDVKVLPMDVFSAASSIEISETFVRFTLFVEETYVVIENREIAKIMGEIFEMNWAKY